MSRKIYRVTLTNGEEHLLRDIINRGKHGAQKRKRAQSLLLANEGRGDEEIAERAGMSLRGIACLRQRFVEDGFEAALESRPRGYRPRSIQGEDEVRLVALVCGPVPEGNARRALPLLADKPVTVENTDTKTVSRETIRLRIKNPRGRAAGY